MSNFQYRIGIDNENLARKMEEVRKECCNLQTVDDNYVDRIKNGSIVACECYCDEELIGCVYDSSRFNSLVIDQVFVKKEFRNDELISVLNSKNIFERIFKTNFSCSMLESERDNSVYESLGYQEGSSGTMRKRI